MLLATFQTQTNVLHLLHGDAALHVDVLDASEAALIVMLFRHSRHRFLLIWGYCMPTCGSVA
jgi:hypothetical protein